MKKILKKFIDIELPQNPRDIVINFDDSKIISSPEIGILASAVVELKKSSNKLIVISTKELRNIISSTNIDRFSNLVFGEKNFLSGGGLK